MPKDINYDVSWQAIINISKEEKKMREEHSCENCKDKERCPVYTLCSVCDEQSTCVPSEACLECEDKETCGTIANFRLRKHLGYMPEKKRSGLLMLFFGG